MIYLILLVFSIFLGPRLLAVQTPVAQLSIYRVSILAFPLLLLLSMGRGKQRFYLLGHSLATYTLYGYIIWLAWAFVSIMWVSDIKLWFQAIFLMTMGILLIAALYLLTPGLKAWYTLIKVAWLSISIQVLWGYFEIISNRYIFADLSKLDKYGTFSSQPLTRMPITYFANQNDYAILMIAYITLCTILLYRARSWWFKGLLVGSMAAAAYLIYRSGSRMALLVLGLYGALTILNHFKLRFSGMQWKKCLLLLITLGLVTYLVKPGLYETLGRFIISQDGFNRISGDMGRVNLYKNGFIFLVETFGFGVGAGNIEVWMAESAYFPTQGIVNMHNWWLEIMVAYGIGVFVIYVLTYLGLMYRLWQLRLDSSPSLGLTSRTLFNFMVIYVFASITSANNMLIEWHWAFMGLIITFVKLQEQAHKEDFHGFIPNHGRTFTFPQR